LRNPFALSLICLATIMSLSTGSSALAQTNRRRSSSQSSYAAKTAAEIKTGREQVASQIKVLTRFLYLFGGITKDIQSAPQTAAAGDGSAAIAQQNDRSKARVIQSIADVRKGLQQLETSFGSSPVLKDYYTYVSGVGDIGVTAERQAQTGKGFDEAGKTLLKAVDRLADALAAMK